MLYREMLKYMLRLLDMDVEVIFINKYIGDGYHLTRP